MADFSITPGQVKPSAAAKLKQGIAGATLLQGNPVYIDTDKTIKLADANDTAEKAVVRGIAVTGASVGQPVLYATEDPDFDLGVTVGSGQVVVLATTAGGLCPDGDISSGSRKTIIGVGKGGTKIKILASALLQGGVV